MTERSTPSASPPSSSPAFLRAWGSIAAAFVAVVLIGVVWMSRHEFGIARDYWQDRLESATQTRRDMLGDWWTSQLGGAEMVITDNAVQAALQGGPTAPAVPRLRTLAKAYGYLRVALLNDRGQLMTSIQLDSSKAPAFPAAAGNRPAGFSVQVFGTATDSVLILVRIPLADSGENRGGMLHLTIDPRRSLFPLLTRELAGTASGQTLLVERVGSDVHVFSPLRDSAPRRLPLSTPNLSTATQRQAHVTFGEHVNNNGTPVLAAAILDTVSGWQLIREVDRVEAFRETRQAIRVYWLIGLLVIAAGIAAMYLAWQFSTRQRSATEHASELHRSERQRRLTAEERERRFAGLLDSSTEEAYLVDGDTMAIESVNNTAMAHLLYAERDLLRRSLFDIVPELDADAFRLELAQLREQPEQHLTVEWEQVRRDGTRYPAEAIIHADLKGQTPAYFVLVRDISDRRNLEQQLRESQKLEAVGRLAGGVAHDFNNILTAIIISAELARPEAASNAAVSLELNEILKAGERAKTLTSQLLSFGRRQIMRPEIVPLTSVVTGIEGMLRRLTPEHLDILVSLSSQSMVRVDVGMMEQVLTNLIVNAIDAMPSGGRITIETSDVALDDAYSRRRPVVAKGRYVLLSVSDTGVGMDEETRLRLFEPFFTTKEKGKGTGLGLSVVHGIVNQFGGHLWVYSEPGQGTTFKVYLPVARTATPLDGPADLLPAAQPRPTDAETRTILLAEDDTAVRRVTARILTAAGFEVLQAENGDQALSVAREYRGPIALLITDVVMPRLGGRALADRMAIARPGMPVLYLSGFTDNAVVHHGILDAGTHFLQKPFTSQTLIDEVYLALDQTT